MGGPVLRDIDLITDIESGGTTSEEDAPKEMDLGMPRAKKLFDMVWNEPNGSMSFDGSARGDGPLVSSSCSELNSNDSPAKNSGSPLEKNLNGESEVGEDLKRDAPRKKSNKKHRKPPRHPKLQLLDVTEQKLVKEIAELTMLKKARIERMETLKKMRMNKGSASVSSRYNVCAMVVTILFCVIIVFQVMQGRFLA